MASTGKDPCAPPLANRQIEARRCCEATLSRRENGTAAGLAVWNWKEKKGQTRNLADVAAALVVVPLSTPNFSLKKKKQTKEEEDSHRTGTSQRDASVLSVFWVSEKVVGVELENGESREEASLLLPLALSL